MKRLMKERLIFLGTGASTGVPVIGCRCGICQSTNCKNKRFRSSALIQTQNKTFLIDIGPDFRQQALLHDIAHIDGLLLTHTHYDHIAGIDELRALNFRQKKPFPCLLSQASLTDMQKRYYYLFQNNASDEMRSAQLDFHVLPQGSSSVHFLGTPIEFITYRQANMEVNGFRIGSLAYVSDIKDYDTSVLSALKGVQTLVLSALRPGPSRVHLSFDEAVEFARKVGAHRTWLTHLSHEVDHEAACRALPLDVQPAYDGLELLNVLS